MTKEGHPRIKTYKVITTRTITTEVVGKADTKTEAEDNAIQESEVLDVEKPRYDGRGFVIEVCVGEATVVSSVELDSGGREVH